MSTRLRLTGVVLCLAAVWMVGMVAAQGQRRAGQKAGTRRDRTSQGDPAAMRQVMMQRMQQQLGASDTEWQVIQPRLQKVAELSRQISRRGSGGMQARPGGRRGQDQETQDSRGQARRPRNDANREKSAVQKASDELQTLLSNASVPPEQIEAKLAVLRASRQAAKQDLAQARTQLQQVLTIKQEARLVLIGLLE